MSLRLPHDFLTNPPDSNSTPLQDLQQQQQQPQIVASASSPDTLSVQSDEDSQSSDVITNLSSSSNLNPNGSLSKHRNSDVGTINTTSKASTNYASSAKNLLTNDDDDDSNNKSKRDSTNKRISKDSWKMKLGFGSSPSTEKLSISTSSPSNNNNNNNNNNNTTSPSNTHSNHPQTATSEKRRTPTSVIADAVFSNPKSPLSLKSRRSNAGFTELDSKDEPSDGKNKRSSTTDKITALSPGSLHDNLKHQHAAGGDASATSTICEDDQATAADADGDPFGKGENAGKAKQGEEEEDEQEEQEEPAKIPTHAEIDSMYKGDLHPPMSKEELRAFYIYSWAVSAFIFLDNATLLLWLICHTMMLEGFLFFFGGGVVLLATMMYFLLLLLWEMIGNESI
jgi:hypothetical protein